MLARAESTLPVGRLRNAVAVLEPQQEPEHLVPFCAQTSSERIGSDTQARCGSWLG
jgi:hypothetical protein